VIQKDAEIARLTVELKRLASAHRGFAKSANGIGGRMTEPEPPVSEPMKSKQSEPIDRFLPGV
jgi:hypothetical protein